MEPRDPVKENLERFSVEWYIEELQDLFVAADAAQRDGSPQFVYVTKLLEELSKHFLKPNQIQQHVDNQTITEYRGKVASLERGTEEFFTTVEIGRWLRVCQEALAKGSTPAEVSALVTPLVEEYLRLHPAVVEVEHIESPVVAPALVQSEPVPIQAPAAAPVEAPKPVTSRKIIPGKKSNSLKPVLVAAGALAGGVAVGFEMAKLSHELGDRSADRSEQAYEHVPAHLREHIVGAPKVGSHTLEFQPRADWVAQADGTYAWGERTLLAEPDGSALYIPTDAKYIGLNKAFILPAQAKGDIDWRGVRFPAQAMRDKQLMLESSGLWQDSQGGEYAVLDGGHLLVITPDGSNEQFLPFNETTLKPIAELDAYYKSPVDMRTIDTRIPAGFVDVAAQPTLQTIQIDLNFQTYDNTNAGVPIYPADYKCQIPEQDVADLAAVEAELILHGRHLGITEAKRPLPIQQYLYELLGKGWAAYPNEHAPHVAGRALDVVLLDATYIPVFARGFISLPKDNEAADRGQTKAEESAELKVLQTAFEARGYVSNGKETWHFDKKK